MSVIQFVELIRFSPEPTGVECLNDLMFTFWSTIVHQVNMSLSGSG